MQLSAIGMARVIAMFELAELNPKGKVFLPALAPRIVERFGFQKYPKVLEDFDLAKGVEFGIGYFADTNVPRLAIYNDGIILDTRSSSEDSKSILLSTLEWLRDDFGIAYTPSTIKRWSHLTNFTFYSDADLTLLNPALQSLCQKMTEFCASANREDLDFHATRVAIDFDKQAHKATRAAFLIERLNMASFNENKYFSEAPLPSDVHIRFVEEFEQDVLGAKVK